MIAGRMISGDVVSVLSGGRGTESSWTENLRQAMEYAANVDVLTQTLFKLVAVGAAVSAALALLVGVATVAPICFALIFPIAISMVLSAIFIAWCLFVAPRREGL